MKALGVISKFIVSITFIISSLTKAIDPVGVTIKVKEYFQAYGGLDFGDYTVYLAIALCVLEFLCGAALLISVKVSFFSLVALLLTAFFTILTFFSALYNLVPDCGCFGDVIKLSAWGTFYKNVILIFFCLVLFVNRKSFRSDNYRHPLGVIFVVIALILALCLYSLKTLPPLDFTDFKRGTDLLEASEGNAIKYKTELIYEKDGVSEIFELDNLPDSTWTFVETISTVISGDEKDAAKTKFIVKDSEGNEVTADLLSKPKVVFLSFYDGKFFKTKSKNFDKLLQFIETQLKEGKALYILSAFTPEQTSQYFAPLSASISDWKEGGNSCDIFYSDYKTLITFNRSNGGITFVNDAKVESKRSALL